MTKLYILQEIKRTTQANGGTPLRKIEFESETGIKRYHWFGVYWARWSDALREAGCLSHHIQAETRQQQSKPLPNGRPHTAPIVRLA
jgi:hypothetical protein